MKKYLFLFLFFCSALNAGISTDRDYFGPSEQLVKRESWQRVDKYLQKMELSRAHYPFFETIANQEYWGHVGYHAADQSYRIYQDIIRITVEEILGIQVREDFHFLRSPGDTQLNLNTIDEFFKYWGKKINNKNEKRAKQLLSMNFGLYSNFDHRGSSSLKLFVKDESKNDVNFIKQLAPFYQEIGISPTELPNLFAIANRWLAGGEGGILLQIAEHSHLTDPHQEAYNFADLQCYPCKRAGYRWGSNPISVHFNRILSQEYLDKKVEVAPQFRLLINNKYTLNPFSPLIIKRWDFYDPSIISSYEEELRAYIRNMRYDAEKAAEYCAGLINLWTAP